MTSAKSLIRDSIIVLEDGLRLVSELSDFQFQSEYPFSSSGIGPHCRHIYDHYTCFLQGIKSHTVSYESRDRDVSLERHVSVVTSKFRELIDDLAQLSERDSNSVYSLEIVHDDSSYCISTTIGRELQFLLSHTLHHFAMIRMMVVSLGVPVSKEFGMAPSTKRYLQTPVS